VAQVLQYLEAKISVTVWIIAMVVMTDVKDKLAGQREEIFLKLMLLECGIILCGFYSV